MKKVCYFLAVRKVEFTYQVIVAQIDLDLTPDNPEFPGINRFLSNNPFLIAVKNRGNQRTVFIADDCVTNIHSPAAQ